MASPRIVVVDYGAGNLRSVSKALERSGFSVEVSRDPDRVRSAEAVVLPGVGAFAAAATLLQETGLGPAVREVLDAGRPYLGLCLGLQLLFEESDEHGVTKGLGMLPGRVEHFPARDTDGSALRVPHIGWNRVAFSGTHPLLEALPEEDYFYFVHCYRAVPASEEYTVGQTEYGGRFATAVARDNAFAVQFHPEKSQGAGRRLLDAFAAWVQSC